MPAPQNYFLGRARFLAVGGAGDFILSLFPLFDDLKRYLFARNSLFQWTFKPAHRRDKHFCPRGNLRLRLDRGLPLLGALAVLLLRPGGFAVKRRRRQKHSEHSEQFPRFHFSPPQSLYKSFQGAIFLRFSLSNALRTLPPHFAFLGRNCPCAPSIRKPLHRSSDTPP